MNKKAKVLIIGLHKTGTTSVASALEILGYKTSKTAKHRLLKFVRHGKYDDAFAIAETYDALKDSPWQHIYRELDRRFPGSKFILTVRDEQSWIASMNNYFGRYKTSMRTWIYGAPCPKGNEDVYLKAYRAHNAGVRSYFKDRPGDLLIMNADEPMTWSSLCVFLGKKEPSVPFPYENRGQYHPILRVFKRGAEYARKLFTDEVFALFS